MGHLRVEIPAPNDDKVLHPAADEDASPGVYPGKVSRTEKRRPVTQQKRDTMLHSRGEAWTKSKQNIRGTTKKRDRVVAEGKRGQLKGKSFVYWAVNFPWRSA